jgi:hypothetical protein
VITPACVAPLADGVAAGAGAIATLPGGAAAGAVALAVAVGAVCAPTNAVQETTTIIAPDDTAKRPIVVTVFGGAELRARASPGGARGAAIAASRDAPRL